MEMFTQEYQSFCFFFFFFTSCFFRAFWIFTLLAWIEFKLDVYLNYFLVKGFVFFF